MKKADWERMDDALHEIARVVGDTARSSPRRIDRVAIILRRLGYLLGPKESPTPSTWCDHCGLPFDEPNDRCAGHRLQVDGYP
jgi:hypothetical protein